MASQLLDDEGHFTYAFEEFIESASSVLVIDELRLENAIADALVVAVVLPTKICYRRLSK